MSDTFYPHCDAMDSLWDGYENGCEYDPTDWNDFKEDPLYYHHRWDCKEVSRTEKAILMAGKNGQFWVPKKLVRYKGSSVYIWEQFEPKYLNLVEADDLGGEELDI